jgi:hypothetical protein
MFHVGQKVVCVNVDDDDGNQCHCELCQIDPTHSKPSKYLKLGQIYTIRWIGEYSWTSNKGIGVCLEGVVRIDVNPLMSDYPFGVHRFRPLEKRTTSIDVFKQMLVPAQKELESIE